MSEGEPGPERPAGPGVRWTDPPGIPVSTGGTVATVGTFDGVHRGHWSVLREVTRQAERRKLPSVLVTFHPHPLRIVRPRFAPPLLTTPDEKKEILAESGLDYAVFLAFTPELARYSPRRFVEEVLVGRLHLAHLVIGYDHGFGRGRSGDVDTLREIGGEIGFGVDVVEPVGGGEAAVSSTRIRKAVQAGDMASAAGGLGRQYSVQGPVVKGESRGRSLGFPTANIRIVDSDKLLPLEGVYAVRASVGGERIDGVLHLGPRPTFRGSPPSVELHLFDFDRDIYGEEVRIEFYDRIRDIHRFASPEALIEAIRGDCDLARRILRKK